MTLPCSLTLLPPTPRVCQECATEHPPHAPHNAKSIYYRFMFRKHLGREPTWADAIAHCTPDVQELWKAVLVKLDMWTEPAAKGTS